MAIGSIGSAIATGLAGMQKGVERMNDAAQKIAEGNVDAEPVVETLIARTEVEANAKVVKTADEMGKSLLDILA